jgi:hypothetical protein
MAHEENGDGNGLAEATRTAVTEFASLSGYRPDRVTGARPGEESGWSLLVDVVEVERIPETTSVLATYRVDADTSGHVQSYERLRRFTRGATDL